MTSNSKFAAMILAGAALAHIAASGPVLADAADFYRGKTVSMLVGYGPGTGYDVYARAVTRHMDRHIPGKPRFVVLNMPGAGSLNMLNHLANAELRDGSAIGMPARQLFFEPLYGNDKAQFKPLDFTWIGSVGKDSPLCFTWHTSGINSFEDALHKEVVVGSTGAQMEALVREVYKTPKAVVDRVVSLRPVVAKKKKSK